MNVLQRFTLSDGSTVCIEGEELRGGGGPVGVSDQVTEAGRTLGDALKSLPALIREVHESVLSRLTAPAQVQIEFGAKISGEVGVIVAKSQAEANFKVSVTWKPADKL